MPGQALLDSPQIVLVEVRTPDLAGVHPSGRLIPLWQRYLWHPIRIYQLGRGNVDQVVILDICHAPPPPGAGELRLPNPADNATAQAGFLMKFPQDGLWCGFAIVDLATRHTPAAGEKSLTDTPANDENVIFVDDDGRSKPRHVSDPHRKGIGI